MKQWNNETINVLLSGEGGQGVQTIAKALMKTAISEGINSTYLASFGVEQRGTPSVAYVVIKKGIIRYPKFRSADVVVIMSERSAKTASQYISHHTNIIFDSSSTDSNLLTKHSKNLLAVESTKIVKEKYSIKNYNIYMLGILIKYLNLNIEMAQKIILEELKNKLKNQESRDDLIDVLRMGAESKLNDSNFPAPTFSPAKSTHLFKGHGKIAEIDPRRCKGCLICVLKCPTKALSLGESLGVYSLPVPTINITKCIACGNCRKFCPDGAIGVINEK